MKERIALAHMRAALVYADLSYCKKRKVGCIIVKDDRVISIGYNGTEPGACNCCEDEFGNTLPNVIHAEHNAIKKLKDSPDELAGSSLFVTYGPCIPCITLCKQYNIKEIYFGTMPTKKEELDFLNQIGIDAYYLPIIK